MNKILTCCLAFFLASGNLSAQYCNAGPTSAFDSNVESVNLTGDAATAISYTGCPGVTSVEDQTALSATVTAGTGYTTAVQFGTCGGNYGGAGEAWIDWNQNMTFEPSESIGTWSGTPPVAVSNFAFTVPMTALNGTTRMRVMQWEGGSLPLNPCGTYSWGSVTDFSIVVTGGVAVLCPIPTNLTANNILPTSANLGWTENGTAMTWDVEWGPQGFAQGTGTVVPANANPFNLTGLSAATDYSFYVRATCGGASGNSSWAGPFNFTTPCAVLTTPWSEDFSGNSTPNCWNESGSESWRYSTSAGYAAGNAGDHTGNGGNYAWIDGSFPNGPNQISTLTSPLIDVSNLTVPLLSFWVFSHNTNTAGYNTLDVEVYDGAAWNLMTTVNSDLGNAWSNVSVGLNTLTITGPIQVRFTITENSPSSPFYNDILIDDIELKDAPNVSISALLDLQAAYCNSAVNTRLVINNLSGNPEGDVPWAVESNGIVIASGSVALAPNASDTIPLTLGGVGPAGPNAMITAYTYMATDLEPADDTVTAAVGMSYTSVNANLSAPIGCAGASNGQITATGVNGLGTYTYMWNDANNQTTAIATGLTAGTYMVTATDTLGCSGVATLTLADPAPMMLSAAGTDVNCFGGNTGSVTATPTGGVAGYSYAWDNGATGNPLANVTAGTYVVTVTDANGCTMSSSVTLNEPATALAGSITDNNDGTATAVATGGTAPYTYQWDPAANNQTGATASNLTPGDLYYVVITDANGCTDVVTIQTMVLNVEDLANVASLKLFPNPTSDNVFVELDLVKQSDVTVSISNVTGQTVYQKDFGMILSNRVELETTDLPNGIYMVQFTIANEQVTEKLIISK